MRSRRWRACATTSRSRPSAEPAEIGDWLLARGFEPSWGWMQFRAASSRCRPRRRSTVREIGPERASRVRPAPMRRLRPAGGARADHRRAARPRGLALLARARTATSPPAPPRSSSHDGAGYLGLAGTAPEHRGKGAQSALLAARIERARELGCDAVFTETGEQLPDRPSASYRNIVRAGFEELYVVPNWLSPAAVARAARYGAWPRTCGARPHLSVPIIRSALAVSPSASDSPRRTVQTASASATAVSGRWRPGGSRARAQSRSA